MLLERVYKVCRQIENPNRARKQQKKVSELTATSKPQLSRREREEIEKQRAKAHYQVNKPFSF